MLDFFVQATAKAMEQRNGLVDVAEGNGVHAKLAVNFFSRTVSGQGLLAEVQTNTISACRGGLQFHYVFNLCGHARI